MGSAGGRAAGQASRCGWKNGSVRVTTRAQRLGAVCGTGSLRFNEWAQFSRRVAGVRATEEVLVEVDEGAVD